MKKNVPFKVLAHKQLVHMGYEIMPAQSRGSRLKFDIYKKSGVKVIVLKSFASSELFRGYPKQVAALHYNEDGVFPLLGSDILNSRDTKNY